jgi:hypothetical protein
MSETTLNTSTEGYTGDTQGAVSPPNISPSLKPRNRAIKDATQAKNIIVSLETNNRQRNIKNARIMAKYNSERPYTNDALKQDGLDWKSNFTTKPLPMLIDKVAPRFVLSIQSMKYLTNAHFPDDLPGADKKTEAFRRELTNLVRQRAGWNNLLTEIFQEDALFGYCAVGWLNRFEWFPKFVRQDEFFIPTGTKQNSDSAQIVVLKERYLIHELFGLIEDKEAAKVAGWDIQQTVTAINNAVPEDRRAQYSNWERLYEDLIRESNVGISHEQGARIIETWHLLARETTGKVTHYIYTANTFKEIYCKEDKFENMSDATSFFSFQHGNGTLHGSKGIGREIYSLAAMLDRTRNEVADRLNLSGKLVIQADEKALKKFRMSVVGNTILIGKGYEVLDRKIEGEVEPFLQLDQFLTSLLDQIAGATTPRVFEGERVTKAQVDFFAQRESESKDNIIGRALNQFADMMTTVQKRACDPNTNEPDALDMQRRLLLVMSREELDFIASQRVAETVRDYTDMERQQIILIAQEARGNPLYNAKELERRKLTAQIDEEFANAVLLPDNDPTVQAEQSRAQMSELDQIVRLQTQIPVSPRDDHMIHLQLMTPALESTAQAIVQDPSQVETLKALLAHATAHFQLATQVGVDKNELAPIGQLLDQLTKALPELEANAQQHAATAEQTAGNQLGATVDQAGGLPEIQSGSAPQLQPSSVQ